jgi:hypothetical protein
MDKWYLLDERREIKAAERARKLQKSVRERGPEAEERQRGYWKTKCTEGRGGAMGMRSI